MRDRTRRFTVGFGPENGGRHLRIVAVDEKTKAWAERNIRPVREVLTTIDQEVSRRAFARELPKPWEPVPPGGAQTPATIAKRFEELMLVGFPRETFDIRPEVA